MPTSHHWRVLSTLGKGLCENLRNARICVDKTIIVTGNDEIIGFYDKMKLLVGGYNIIG